MPIKFIIAMAFILSQVFISQGLTQSITAPQHSNAPLNIATEDGTTSTFPYKLKVTNGTLTNNGDGTASLTTGSGGGVSAINAQDEGVGIGTFTTLNAAGAGVTGAISNNTLTLTIPGGAGSSQWQTSNIGIGTYGNVGIGTTTPQARFVVLDGNIGIGTINADGGQLIVKVGNVGINSAWPGTALDVQGTVRSTAFNTNGAYTQTGVSANTMTGVLTTAGISNATTAISNSASYTQSGTSANTMTGNLGIGVNPTSSGYNLYVLLAGANNGNRIEAGSSKYAYMDFSSGATSPTLEIGINGTGASHLITNSLDSAGILTTATAAPIQFGTNSDMKMTLSSVGNLGIGSASPGNALDVTGFIRASTGIGIGTYNVCTTSGNCPSGGGGGSGTVNSGIANQQARYASTGTAVSGSTLIYDDLTNVGIGTVTPIATLNISSTANQDLFRIDDNATNDLSPFIVNKDGNVGIGTNNTETAKLLVMGGNVGLGTWIPDQALDVKGTVIISGNLGVGTLQTNSTLTVASTLAQDMFRVDDNGAGDPSPFIIDQGGNVGIGTTTPGGALTITSGNVGIGTWLPVAGLDIVNGVAGLRISGSGADSAVMTSGGNWGIGSINPTQTLDVAGNSTFSMNVGIGTNRVTTSALTIMNGNVGIGTWVVDGGAFIVKTGNIGISTIRPGQTLDIQGTGIRAIDYYSGDGTQGATLTCGGVSVTQIIIKDGLITSCTGT